MAINVATLAPASLKSKNVATEQYVDTSIASIDISGDINANNDVFAQKLGYANYQAMVSAAASGQTVINGGYINTGLIQANSIVANQVNTNGLIAENINASEITGKTITGGNIVGANITGVTIRASYLDLDGELEVLTNFYLCVNGNTTGVPQEAILQGRYKTYNSSDTDAVLSTVYSNLYRIPALSTVKEPTKETYLTGVGSYANTYVKSYNTANAGHNIKCIKPRPQLNYPSPTILRLSAYGAYVLAYYNLEVSHTVALYCVDDLVGTFAVYSEKNTWAGGNGGESSLVYGAIVNGNRVTSFSSTVNGITFTINVSGVSGMAVLDITATCINQYITKDFTSGDILRAVVTQNPTGSWTQYASTVFKTTSAMTINNMI